MRIGLFNTPANWEALMAWINRHDTDSRAHVMTSAGMAWNLALETVDETMKEMLGGTMELRYEDGMFQLCAGDETVVQAADFDVFVNLAREYL